MGSFINIDLILIIGELKGNNAKAYLVVSGIMERSMYASIIPIMNAGIATNWTILVDDLTSVPKLPRRRPKLAPKRIVKNIAKPIKARSLILKASHRNA